MPPTNSNKHTYIIGDSDQIQISFDTGGFKIRNVEGVAGRYETTVERGMKDVDRL